GCADFVFSMGKWRGYGGATEHWDHTMESLTLMAGLAAATERIDLYATVHPLLFHPAVAAKMLVTIDDISGGRAGINVVTGWNKYEFSQMALWPGDEYYEYRYEYAAEWLDVVVRLWADGRARADLYKRGADVEAIDGYAGAASNDAAGTVSRHYEDFAFLTATLVGAPDTVVRHLAELDRAGAHGVLFALPDPAADVDFL